MKTLKKVICLVLSIGMIATLSACGSTAGNTTGGTTGGTTDGTNTTTPATPDETTPTTPDDDNNTVTPDAPVTVTDQAGREVTVESDPTTIVSGYYISTSLLLALGEKDNIKGIESKAETRAIYSLCGMDTTALGGYGTKKGFETEKATALGADLIILPYSLKNDADNISITSGAPVIVVNPESDALMQETLTILGKVTRNESRAEQIINYIDNSVSAMQDAVKGVDTQVPSVYLAGTKGLLKTAGSAMYQNTLIVNSLATNAAAEKSGADWADVTYDEILIYQPDVIVIAAESSATVESVLSDPLLTTVNAVINQKVYKMPSVCEAWDSPVPSAFLGSLWLASQYHTGYTYDQFKATAVDFYSTFYNIDVTNVIG